MKSLVEWRVKRRLTVPPCGRTAIALSLIAPTLKQPLPQPFGGRIQRSDGKIERSGGSGRGRAFRTRQHSDRTPQRTRCTVEHEGQSSAP